MKITTILSNQIDSGKKGQKEKFQISVILGLFATMIHNLYQEQINCLTLNGLFGVNVKVLNYIQRNVYPKRYGYPFYFSSLSAISFFKIFQINNTITYGNQKSNLSSIKMFFTLIRLTFHFLILKIKTKMLIGKYQRSAFLDILFLTFILALLTFIRFVLIFSSMQFLILHLLVPGH